MGSEVYLEQPNATVQEKVISIRLLDKAVAFDAFQVYFPDTISNAFHFPINNTVLIDLAIRCNWPSITFHSKLMLHKCSKPKKDGAVCIALICGPLKENSGRKPEPGFTV